MRLAAAVLWLVLVPAVVGAQGVPKLLCSKEIVNNKGDVIRGTLRLDTSDPKENYENEPVLFRSSDGVLNDTIVNDWNGLHPFFFVAAGKNITLDVVASDFDNDESCDMAITINGRPAFTPSQKNFATGGALHFGLASLGLGGAAAAAGCGGSVIVIVAASPFVCQALFWTAGGMAVFAGESYIIANDPVDPVYWIVEEPVVGSVPKVTHLSNNKLKNAFQTVLNLSATSWALSNAAVISSNRYEGAVAAGDPGWADVQFQYAQWYLGQVGQQFFELDIALASLQKELGRAGWNVDLTPGGSWDILDQYQIWQHEGPGAPTVGSGPYSANPIHDVMLGIGVPPEQVEQTTWAIRGLRIDRLPTTLFPDAIGAARDSLTDMGYSFMDFSR